MSEFQIISEKRHPLKVHDVSNNTDLLDYYRWEHRVTIGYRGRRFMVFLDNLKATMYIEEITSGHPVEVTDDSLFESLSRFAGEGGFLQVLLPMPKPTGYAAPKKEFLGPAIKV